MEKQLKNFIIDVIPITRIPLSRQQFFSYESSQKLPAGALVTIPLFHRTLNGVVINSRDDFDRLGNIQLKKVINVIEKNFLTPEQLELAQFISDYYICPLGVALKFFVPKRVEVRNQQPTTYNLQPKKIKLTREQQDAVNEMVKKNNWEFLLFGPASSGKTEVYIHSILNLKEKDNNSQFLILLPELTLTPQAIERYGAHFKPEEMAIIHSKISKGELYQNWQKIKSGEAKIIIGTRMAVFSPFKNLKLIVIDEEQDMSFKQWNMSPRHDARTVAEELAKIYKAKIVRGSATPSVESYHKTLNKEYKLLELPKLNLADAKYKMPGTSVEIADMRKEHWVKNLSPISKLLQSEIAYALKNKLQTILFINRQGMSAFSVCANCKTVLRCPKCDRALIYGNDGTYKCLHCNYDTGALVTCPKCRGMIFKNIGLGTQKIEREIQKLFPSARIKRADFETMKKRRGTQELYKEFMRADFDILIGTQMVAKGWDNPRVGLVGIIDADNLLALADFKTDEKAYQLIVQIAGRTARPGSKFPGKVVIQTFNPENFVVKTAAEMNYEKFYKKEIEERKTLNYPPFRRLIKLAYQHESKEKVEKEAKKLYDEIKARSGNIKGFAVSKPQDPLVPKVRGRFRKQMVIKFKADMPQALRKILEKLGSEWITDIDPIGII